MIKKILKWIGGVLLFVILLIVGILVYTGYKQAQYADTAVPYIKKVVPVLSQWDMETAKPLFVSEVFEDASDEEFEKLLNWLSKLGNLESMGEPQFSQVSSGTTVMEGASTIVTYKIDVKYEHGDALVTIRLLDLGDKFEVYYFDVNSTALLD